MKNGSHVTVFKREVLFCSSLQSQTKNRAETYRSTSYKAKTSVSIIKQRRDIVRLTSQSNMQSKSIIVALCIGLAIGAPINFRKAIDLISDVSMPGSLLRRAVIADVSAPGDLLRRKEVTKVEIPGELL